MIVLDPESSCLVASKRSSDESLNFRYVFGRILYEKRLSEEELRGLREDKLKSIRSLAKFLAEDAA